MLPRNVTLCSDFNGSDGKGSETCDLKLQPVAPKTLISGICCLSVPNVEIFANLSSISKTTIGDAIKSMSTFFFVVVDVEFDASLNLVGSFTRLVTRIRPMALQLPYRLNKSNQAESWYL
ncbi:hypothetical protein T05_1670 [Trichinella murrelli]|uniref:Uncharacterized protein n=1 Tax=Trichinella murrelli TaxID=144512 RepID=A0A0V0U9W2_9BILA|nr:hypothetical protein T05_1670 [Trichinella murrelli]